MPQRWSPAGERGTGSASSFNPNSCMGAKARTRLGVSKRKGDACIRSLGLAPVDGEHARGQAELVGWLRANYVGTAIMEASGGYEPRWTEALRASHVEVRVVDPKRVRYFAKSAEARGQERSDRRRDDRLVLAKPSPLPLMLAVAESAGRGAIRKRSDFGIQQHRSLTVEVVIASDEAASRQSHCHRPSAARHQLRGNRHLGALQACARFGQSWRVASRAPSDNTLSFARAICGCTRPPRPQSVPAITFSRPTAFA
jgi:hypothetical protein